MDSNRSIALIEVPPLHCFALVCVCVFLAQLLLEHCKPHLNVWHTVWHFLQGCRQTDTEVSSVWDFSNLLLFVLLLHGDYAAV